jgi:alkaline phosphatase D
VVNLDQWDGYPAARARILTAFAGKRAVRNPVVISGDWHSAWVNDLKLDYDDPAAPVVGTEFVTTSISSGGDGFDSDPNEHPFLQINPHLKFYNNQRGYVRTQITPDAMTSDFVRLPYVFDAGAPAEVRRTYVVEDRVPTLNQTYDNPPPPAAATLSADDAKVIAETVAWETKRP